MENKTTFILDSYGKSTGVVVKDKNGKAVNPGDMVFLQHCTGRFGQTSTICGTFVRADTCGVFLTLDTPYTRNDYTYKAGQEVQFAITSEKGVYFRKHEDFEHIHQTYMHKIY
jgi:hypothetical protein